MRNVVILGSTGSIGTSALQVVDRHTDKLRVLGLAADRRHDLLAGQARKYLPEHVTLRDKAGLEALKTNLKGLPVQILEDTPFSSAIEALAVLPDADVVLNAIVGVAGLKATAAALGASKTVALANKESMVAAGPILRKLAKETKATIMPVDSEHSAIFQCLRAGRPSEVRRLVLTGSGGPFLDRADLENVTVAEALQHPTWKMGKKITIDCATMMNKALEIIEASYLFDIPAEKISVVIHPQSIVHSMVEFADGAIVCQMSKPDMRLPIQYALLYPVRADLEVANLDLESLTLSFRLPDPEKFGALSLGYRAAKEGGITPAVLNAANEVAVRAFLDGKIRFTQIVEVTKQTMDDVGPGDAPGINDVLRASAWAADVAEDLVHCL